MTKELFDRVMIDEGYPKEARDQLWPLPLKYDVWTDPIDQERELRRTCQEMKIVFMALFPRAEWRK